jgi:hypothetical protein
VTARQFAATLRRRWYVLVLLIVVTVAGAYAVHKRPIMTQACADLFVKAPPTHNNPNVLTNGNDTLVATAGVVTRAVMSAPAIRQIRAEGMTADYDAEMTNTGSNETPLFGSPTLQICSLSTDPNMALRTTAAVSRQFGHILRQRQLAYGTPPDWMIHVTVISESAALPILGRPSQAYLGVMLLGIVASIPLTLWSDPLLERRRRRRAARAANAVSREPIASP